MALGGRNKDLGEWGVVPGCALFPCLPYAVCAESVCGICDPTLITQYVADVQEHFKKTENLSTMLHPVSSYSSQLSSPARPLFFFAHSLLQTYRPRETRTPESPIHDLDRLQGSLSQRSACVGTSVR